MRASPPPSRARSRRFSGFGQDVLRRLARGDVDLKSSAACGRPPEGSKCAQGVSMKQAAMTNSRSSLLARISASRIGGPISRPGSARRPATARKLPRRRARPPAYRQRQKQGAADRATAITCSAESDYERIERLHGLAERQQGLLPRAVEADGGRHRGRSSAARHGSIRRPVEKRVPRLALAARRLGGLAGAIAKMVDASRRHQSLQSPRPGAAPTPSMAVLANLVSSIACEVDLLAPARRHSFGGCFRERPMLADRAMLRAASSGCGRREGSRCPSPRETL